MWDSKNMVIKLLVYVFLKELIQEQGCNPLFFCLSLYLLPHTLWSLQKACSPRSSRGPWPVLWSSIWVGHFTHSHLSVLSVLSCQYFPSAPLMASGSPKGSSPVSVVTGGSGTGTFPEVWMDWCPYRCGGTAQHWDCLCHDVWNTWALVQIPVLPHPVRP